MMQVKSSEAKRSARGARDAEVNGIVSDLRFVKALIAATASLPRDLYIS
jgi:hypothetical protein